MEFKFSVFQPEVMTTNTKYCDYPKVKTETGKPTVICSDSKSGIQAIGIIIRSRLILDCKKSPHLAYPLRTRLVLLGSLSIQMRWSIIDRKPSSLFQNTLLAIRFQDAQFFLRNDRENRCSISTCKQTKMFVLSPNRKFTQDLLSLNKPTTDLLTGHWRLKKHLNNIRFSSKLIQRSQHVNVLSRVGKWADLSYSQDICIVERWRSARI